MKKQIILNDKKINYTLRRSKKARRVHLAVHCDGSVVATIPAGLQENIIERFIMEKSKWLFSKIAFFKKNDGTQIRQYGRLDYFKNKKESLNIIENKAVYFSDFYKYPYKKVSIRNQKTRWGSCSRKGNLSFNYKIMFLPEQVQNYIIAHEICHLKEFNHSRNFWNLVAKAVPNYLELRKKLRQIRVNYC